MEWYWQEPAPSRAYRQSCITHLKCMAVHKDCQHQEQTAAKEAPDFDVMCTAFHWIRHKTRGEEGELSIQAA